jgi:CheY-like chemotaxis protein
MSVRSQSYLGTEFWKPQQKRVLIVEDNHLDSALFGALLESQGHQVLKAANATDGLKLARENEPDLIIMDVRLPRHVRLRGDPYAEGRGCDAAIPIIVARPMVRMP